MPEPPVVKAAVERVDEIAGSIRYDGKKVVGIAGPEESGD